jgi:adenylate cyclase
LARLAEESGWFDNVLRAWDLVYCSRIKPERTTAILDRLKQRKLVQWALAYLAGAWFVMQLVDVLGGRWGVTEYMARVVDLVLVVGLFVTLVVAWYHGEKGRQRVSGPELLILAGLLGVGTLGLQFLSSNEPEIAGANNAVATSVPLTSADQAPWIAVLPFRTQTEDPSLVNFADGLTEDITAGLSAFTYFLILSRNATEHVDSNVTDIREISRELGASYVMQGTLRKAGEKLRLSVQLVDGKTGTNVWTESFDRDFSESGALKLQDEITDTIVATVADPYGVVARTLAAPTVDKSPETLTPYEAVLRWIIYQQRISPEDHAITRDALERAVELKPGYTDARACLANIYLQEYMQGFNLKPGALDRALREAQRAVNESPASGLANYSLAQVYFFRQDLGAFYAAAERTLELNPRDSNAMAMLGILMGYGGNWERSVELTTAAMALNPNHPGWYRFNIFFNEYRQGNYAEALNIAQRINMPEYWADPMAQMLAHTELGNADDARVAAKNLLRVWPEFESKYYKHGLKNWIFAQPELIRKINESLRKAGLNMVIEADELSG